MSDFIASISGIGPSKIITPPMCMCDPFLRSWTRKEASIGVSLSRWRWGTSA